MNRTLYGLAEIAEEIGAKRGTVTQWYRRGSRGLPRPTAVLACGPVWSSRRIEPWLELRRRLEDAPPAA
jgi:hypothetical protein